MWIKVCRSSWIVGRSDFTSDKHSEKLVTGGASYHHGRCDHTLYA